MPTPSGRPSDGLPATRSVVSCAPSSGRFFRSRFSSVSSRPSSPFASGELGCRRAVLELKALKRARSERRSCCALSGSRCVHQHSIMRRGLAFARRMAVPVDRVGASCWSALAKSAFLFETPSGPCGRCRRQIQAPHHDRRCEDAPTDEVDDQTDQIECERLNDLDEHHSCNHDGEHSGCPQPGAAKTRSARTSPWIQSFGPPAHRQIIAPGTACKEPDYFSPLGLRRCRGTGWCRCGCLLRRRGTGGPR